jgi:DNA/RNA endonuclease G (NUC1)
MRVRSVSVAFVVAMSALIVGADGIGASTVARSEVASAAAMPAVRIAEFHYDNGGTDTGEAIEVSGPAGTDLTGWQIVLYNGNGGAPYDTKTLSGSLPATCGTRGVAVQTYPSNGIQNGSPDGIALVSGGTTVVEFLSYEGTFVAVGGPANGMTSTDIGASEAGTESINPVTSLQRNGDGTWSSPKPNTFGTCNDEEPPPPPEVASVTVSPASATIIEGTTKKFTATAFDSGNQPISGVAFTWSSSNTSVATVDAAGIATGVSEGDATIVAMTSNGTTGTASVHVDPPAPPAEPPSTRIVEIHYDNLGTDVNEAIEIEGSAGADLTGWSVVLYNGGNGAAYGTRVLAGTIPSTCGTRGVVVLFYPQDGIQNGSPDGIALISAAGEVVEFLSYEGTFTAVDGPAAGMTATNIGALESSSRAGLSLQRDASNQWWLAQNSFGLCNGVPTLTPNTISISGRAGGDVELPVGFEDQLFAVETDSTGTAIPTTVTWSSAAPDIASIDQNGVVRALAAGTAVLRATAADGTIGTLALPTRIALASTTAVYAGNTEFGIPTDTDPSDDFIVVYPQYTASYNPARGTPNWVSYELDPTHYGPEDRCDCFTFDQQLPPEFTRYTTADYTGAGTYHGYGIDRGHLARSFDRTSAGLDNARTFYFTNIVPQAADLNQGPWASFETFLGDLARTAGKEVYIVAGVAGNKGTVKDEGKIVIPDGTWKVAVVMPHDSGLANIVDYRDLEVIAVSMPNQPGVRSVPWQSYKTTVDAIEASTGYDLLALLPDKIENIVESGTMPPFARVDGPYTLSEGSGVAMSGAASFDPNGTVVSYAWNFGDGTSASGQLVNHIYTQDGAYTVTLVVTDNDGVTDEITTTATVANVAPSIAAFAGATGLLPGEQYNSSGSFTDPGSDPWTAAIDYGDGAGKAALALTGKTFALAHTYLAAGTFTVTVEVSDDHVTSTATRSVTVISQSDAIQTARGMVDALVAGGKLDAKTAKGLSVKLTGAIKDIEKGDVNFAIEKLQSVIDQMDALVRTGKVSSSDTAPIRMLLDRVIQSL